MKFYEGIWGYTIKNWVNFGGDLSLLRWVKEQNNPTIIVVAWLAGSIGNDPEALG